MKQYGVRLSVQPSGPIYVKWDIKPYLINQSESARLSVPAWIHSSKPVAPGFTAVGPDGGRF